MTVLYFGPISPAHLPSRGGYEAANRKNVDKLRALGVHVVEFSNPRIREKWGFIGKLAYFKMMLTPLSLIAYAGHNDAVVHHTPLKGLLMIPSLWLLLLAHVFGVKTVLDLRAGTWTSYYQTHGRFLRWLIKLEITLADAVTVEGSRYIADIQNVMHINKIARYFPNLALCADLAPIKRDMQRINLFYFGRITKDKGIDLMLDMMNYLTGNYHLYLAGTIAPDVDKETLNRNDVIYLGLLSRDQLKEQMRGMHYFVFPTLWAGEGQSNSLIEAMSNGLVPLTSDKGFCREVVADCGFVFSQDAKGNDYADTIKSIGANEWEELSERCQQHIVKHHNIDVEIPRLLELYTALLRVESGRCD